jgi:hypothetical protein
MMMIMIVTILIILIIIIIGAEAFFAPTALASTRVNAARG